MTAAAQDSSGVSVVGRFNLGGAHSKSLALSEEIAYVGTYRNTLSVLDVADPREIEELGNCNVRYIGYDVVVRDETAFLACASQGFAVVDVHDPADPRLLARLETPGYSWGVDLARDYALVAAGYLRLIDITDPARPEEVANVEFECVRGVAVSGNYAYLAGDRFYVLDISEPCEPRQVASLDLPLLGWRVTIADDRAYVAEIFTERQGDNYIHHSNLRIIDIAEPEEPRLLGVFGELPTHIWNVAVEGDFAYLAASSHLRVLNVSDPENPEEVGYYRTSGTAFDIAVVESFAYVAQYDNFVIYNCSNAIGEPDLVIAEENRAHDFGQVVVGLSGLWNFPLLNAGHFRLTIDGMEIDDDAFVLHCEQSRWHWQEGFPAGADAHDRRLGGVEFDGENFYVTGGADGDMVNWVYVFNREGELVRRFEQFAESPWGMRDLAWDGELLWGADSGTVYGFTTVGELETEFQGPLEAVRSIAWDPRQELLWVTGFNAPIFGVDREGNVVVEIEPPGVRVYGMAWYPEDPDDCPLYLAIWDPEHPLSLHKVDVETGEVVPVRDDLPARLGERAGGGLAVTDDLNPPCWDLVALVDGVSDAVEVWQHTDYYRGESFTIQAENEVSVTVEFAPGEAREYDCLLYTSPSPRDLSTSRMPSSA